MRVHFVSIVCVALAVSSFIQVNSGCQRLPSQSPERVDAEIRKALKVGKFVVVSVIADWSIHTKQLNHEIVNNEHIIGLIRDHGVIVLEADISSESAYLPASLEASNAEVRLPMVFILGPNLARPMILQSESLSVADIITSLREAMEGPVPKE